MARIEKISFDLQVVTPMFLSGADGKLAELRPPSLKGLLRYWWRALQAESKLNMLRERESKIFGSSDAKQGGGSCFSIRISNGGTLPIKDKFPYNPLYKVPVEGKSFKINILEYLAYGTYDYVRVQGNVFNRDYYPINTRFKVIFNFLDQEWKNEVLKAIYVFNLFGGIGSRNRNGFGSFNILNKVEAFEDIKDIFSINKPYEKENLEQLIKKSSAATYSSFSQGTKVFRAKTPFNNALDPLADTGKIYKNARNNLERKHHFEKRQYVGAPIVERCNTKSFLDRHAKPYFIKIAKENAKYRAYILYLPSKYCCGLEKDRAGEVINHDEVDEKFSQVCAEFNKCLSQNMETIL